MTPLMLSALFPESDPTELAALARELGFAGLDLMVHGQSPADVERTLWLLAAAEAPAPLLTVDAWHPAELDSWAAVAAAGGCTALRTAPWPAEVDDLPTRLAELAAVGERHGVQCLVPNHAGTVWPDVDDLARWLGSCDARWVAAALAPDHVPRSRAGDHAAWLARVALPPIGALVLAGYRWTSEIGAGNIRVWTPRPAMIMHGLTPWTPWLQRIRATGFDGLLTFGDPALTTAPAELLRILRDDLRYVRRVW